MIRRHSVPKEFRVGDDYVVCTSPLLRWSRHRPLIALSLEGTGAPFEGLTYLRVHSPGIVGGLMAFVLIVAAAVAWFAGWSIPTALVVASILINPFTVFVAGFYTGEFGDEDGTWRWLFELDATGMDFRGLTALYNASRFLLTPFDLLTLRVLMPAGAGWMAAALLGLLSVYLGPGLGPVWPDLALLGLGVAAIVRIWGEPSILFGTHSDPLLDVMRAASGRRSASPLRRLSGRGVTLRTERILPVIAPALLLVGLGTAVAILFEIAAAVRACAWTMAAVALLHVALRPWIERHVAARTLGDLRRRLREGQRLYREVMDDMWESGEAYKYLGVST